MAGANTNFVTGPGLRHGSLIYTHDNYRYSKHKQLSDGCTRLKCTSYKTCRGAATLSADRTTITPRLAHNHLNDRDNIVASQYREGMRGNVTERDADLKADLFALTHSPRIREIISPSFLAFPSPGRIERRHGGETRSHVLMYRVIYGF